MGDLPTPFMTAADAVSTARLPAVSKNMSTEAIDRTASDFEAVFLSQMLETMFAGIRTDGPFGGGPSEEVFRSMMLEEYAKVIAKNGGVGLSDAIKRDMLRLQEVNAK